MFWLRIAAVVVLTALVGCSSSPESTPTGIDLDVTAAEEGGISSRSTGVMGSVTGSAHLQVFGAPGLGLRRLTFHAVRAADGSVSGEWQLVAGASILHGDVDCLTILSDGKTARLAGIVTDAKFTTFQVGTAFALEVVDNGQGQGSDPDQTSSLRAFRNAPPEVGRHFCETGQAPADLDMMEVLRGNFEIHVPKN